MSHRPASVGRCRQRFAGRETNELGLAMWAHTRRGLAAAAATAVAGVISFRLSPATDQPFDRLQRWKIDGRARQTARRRSAGTFQAAPRLVKFLDQLLPGDREPTQTSVLFPLQRQEHRPWFLASVGYRVVGVEAVPLANPRCSPALATRRHRAAANFVVRTALAQVRQHHGGRGRFVAYDAAANEQAVGRAHDAAFDRGALVAVRPEDREAYARALRRCSRRARACSSWLWSTTLQRRLARSAPLR